RRKHARLGQAVEQGGLAGIGIADERYNRIGHPLSAGAVQLARALDSFELRLDPGDPLLDKPPVGFDLSFTGTPKESETAALPFQMCPRTDQSAFLISQMCKLDLQRALARARTPPENLQDETGAVEHFGAPRPFQITLLYWRNR